MRILYISTLDLEAKLCPVKSQLSENLEQTRCSDEGKITEKSMSKMAACV